MTNMSFEIQDMIYSLKRLIFVNSANHGYSELVLDQHLAMYGRNNGGKTASLASTKLVLFPETNFSDCKSKFRFEGKGNKVYDKDDSYDFYFPDSNSFIGLEVQNRRGIFCMILYRSSGYSYGRFFIPCEFNELQEYFFDRENKVVNPQLTVELVEKLCKQYKGHRTTDKTPTSELISLMYGDYGKFGGLYCIVPLKDSNKTSVEAFRNIYHLAFDSGTSETETLPSAIATLIEMNRTHSKQAVGVDFNKSILEFNQLTEDKKQLTKLENLKPDYDHIKSDFDALIERCKSYSIDFIQLKHQLDANNEYYGKLGNTLQDQIREADIAWKNPNEHFKNQSRIFNETTGERNVLERDLQKINAEIYQVEAMLTQDYKEHQPQEVLDLLNEHLSLKQDELKSYASKEDTRNFLIQAIDQLKAKEKRLKSHQEILSDSSTLTFNKFSQSAKDVFNSLNPQFAKLKIELSDHEIAKFEDFASLFSVDYENRRMMLKDVLISKFTPFDLQANLNKIHSEIEPLIQEIINLKKSITNSRNILTIYEDKKLLEAKVNEVNKDITETKDIIKLLKNYDTNKENLKVKQDEFDSYGIELIKIQDELNQLEKLKNDNYQIFRQLESKLNNLQNNISKLQRMNALYKRAELFNLHLPSTIANEIPEIEIDLELKESLATEVIDQASEIQSEKSKFSAEIKSLLEKINIEGVDPFQLIHNLFDYGHIIDRLNTTFNTLGLKLTQLRTNIKQHNSMISMQIAEINDAHQLLELHIENINTKLNKKKISNLSNIRLKLELKANFTNLLNTITKHNTVSDNLADQTFYDELMEFFNKHKNAQGRIDMRNLIQSISYQYELNNQLTTKSQSGGTTSTIKAFVLSVLLNEIKIPHSQLKMPIIVDEISTLDQKNTTATIAQIGEQGFSIFCATPSYSYLVSKLVGNWVFLDKNTVKFAKVANCIYSILPEHVQHFGVAQNA